MQACTHACRCIVNDSTRLNEAWEAAAGNVDGGAHARASLRAAHAAGVSAEGEGLQWGARWAGASVGLVRAIQPAGEIVQEVLSEAEAAIRRSAALLA